MGTYNIHAGHCPQGQGASGAVGILQESVEDRKVKNRVISALKGAGHTVYDCTCDEKTTAPDCLKKIVAKCNAHSVDLDVSIHLNSGRNDYSGDSKTGGVEVWCYNEKTKAIAAAICASVSSALGITNRGVKYSQALFVLRKTNAPAILVECAFVDDKDDADRWNADKCGDAIASAIAGKTVSGTASAGSAPAAVPASKPATTNVFDRENWIRRLQSECNKQGFSNQRVDGIAGKNTLAGCPTVRKGARGNITRLLQERLNSLGFNCGAEDGIFGSGTRAAVIAFQRAHGLSADGIVGKNTWRALLGL